MLNDLLLAFFLGMPAVAALFLARDLHHPLARRTMFWGAAIATVLAAVVIVPMLACDGTLLTEYRACLGGDGVASAFTGAQPVIRAAAFVYVLAGPPLAVMIWLVDLLTRRATRAP